MAWDGPGDDPYDHPHLYDLEYGDHVEDVDFYRALAQKAGRVLELGVGTGRLALPIARCGVSVVGVEQSAPMRQRLAERLQTEPRSVAERVVVRDGDFRRLDLGERFPLVILPFNALHHCADQSEVEATLRVLAAHVAPGGLVAFDCYLPDWTLYARAPGRYEHRLYPDPLTGETWRSWEESHWDDDRWIHTVWYLFARGREKPTRCELRLHMFAEASVRHALARAGLVCVRDRSGFQDEPFDPSGTRWVGVYAPGDQRIVQSEDS
jgi:SAM-dependent methyltransferase